jgi:hypothetical protein
MPDRAEWQPTETTNLDIYGHDPIPWSRARDALVEGTPTTDVTMFLGTTDPDGRPHAAGFGAAWLRGDVYFTSGPKARKTRNLAANPAASISGRLDGIDVVLEGDVTRVTDAATLEEVAEIYRNGGWPAQVERDALTAPFSAPSAGPPPWYVFRFTIRTAYGVATAEPHGATRWHF